MPPPVSSVLSPVLLPPYPETGVRLVPILDPLAPKLLAAKVDSIYIFSEDNGKMHLTEMQYQRLWNEYAEQTGISTTAHQLQHSSATMLFECDVDVNKGRAGLFRPFYGGDDPGYLHSCSRYASQKNGAAHQ